MDGPVVHVGDPEAVAAEEIGRHPGDMLPEHGGHAWGQVHPEPEIGHLPRHVVEHVHVRERGQVDQRQARGGRVDGDGSGCVREDCVGDDLVHVVGGGLEVQAGELHAEKHAGLAPGHGGVGDGGERGEGGVTAHVADVEALDRGRHGEVACQQDVHTGGRVAGAGDHREHLDVSWGQAGVCQAGGQRLFAEGQRFVHEAAHARAGAQCADVLDPGVHRGMPARHARVSPDAASAPTRRVVGREELVPRRTLIEGSREGGADTADRRLHRECAPSPTWSPSPDAPRMFAASSPARGTTRPERAAHRSRSSSPRPISSASLQASVGRRQRRRRCRRRGARRNGPAAVSGWPARAYRTPTWSSKLPPRWDAGSPGGPCAPGPGTSGSEGAVVLVRQALPTDDPVRWRGGSARRPAPTARGCRRPDEVEEQGVEQMRRTRQRPHGTGTRSGTPERREPSAGSGPGSGRCPASRGGRRTFCRYTGPSMIKPAVGHAPYRLPRRSVRWARSGRQPRWRPLLTNGPEASGGGARG